MKVDITTKYNVGDILYRSEFSKIVTYRVVSVDAGIFSHEGESGEEPTQVTNIIYVLKCYKGRVENSEEAIKNEFFPSVDELVEHLKNSMNQNQSS